MKIEKEIFKRSKVDFSKLKKYGFEKINNSYIYSKNIMDDTFRIDVTVDSEGTVEARVIDLAFGDEYTNFRIEDNTGSFVGQVLYEFKELLNDIRKKCFIGEAFIFEQSNRIANLIKEKYENEPEFEWENSPGSAIFRNSSSKKWYGIIMNVDRSKIEKTSSGEVEIMNVKLAPNEILELLEKPGFYPAYHMNKKSWITMVLDNTIKDEEIMNLVEKSYSYTSIIKSNEWIVPANPKYFDIEKALKESNIINWKQSTDIKANDIVYLYVAQPYSSIMYKFKVIEANIPYKYNDENLKIQKVMKINLLEKYNKGEFSFNKLKEYGVNAVRGPRYMPVSLSESISKKSIKQKNK